MSNGVSERPNSTTLSRSGPSNRNTTRSSRVKVRAPQAERISERFEIGDPQDIALPRQIVKKTVSFPPLVVTKSKPPPGSKGSLASVPAGTSRPGPPMIGSCAGPNSNTT